MDGKKTYIGLVAVLLGMIMKDYMDQQEAERLVSSLFEVAGVVMAAYGRYNAKTPLSPEAIAATQTTNIYTQ